LVIDGSGGNGHAVASALVIFWCKITDKSPKSNCAFWFIDKRLNKGLSILSPRFRTIIGCHRIFIEVDFLCLCAWV
jgi:hypothetical protein